ncbi:LexA repressor [Bienertia sinuspersici]
MKPSKLVTSGFKRRRPFHLKSIPTLALLCAAVFIGSAFVVTDYKEKISPRDMLNMFRRTKSTKCEGQCSRPVGTERLPKGIITKTSDLEMRPLWGAPLKKKSSINLLALAVGLKQKENVDKIVRKFLVHNFAVMLFHYDGNVDDWSNLRWSNRVLHIVAAHQTKWWFAKRFLHPDVVSRYAYIFLWDEDLGVENFSVHRYLYVIKKEGLEISQPALDPDHSEVHHKLTARQKGPLVHRRINKTLPGGRKCDENSTEPPCTGWVEMMAPVFSRAAWRCAWYMIQNDFVHAWGVDFQLGYCVQGDRTKKIGIVDSDYVIHYGIPTLGDTAQNKTDTEASSQTAKKVSSSDSLQEETSTLNKTDARNAVRKQSLTDLERFKNRWKKAVKDDDCWTDPFQQPIKKNC